MKILLILISVYLIQGCGALNPIMGNSSKHPAISQGYNKGTGCVQGVLLDGLTNDRVAINSENKEDGIYAMVRNKRIDAKPVSTKNEKLTGEYVLCNIPLDSSFPIFADYLGFQSFESVIKIDSSVAAQSADSDSDVNRHYPTMTGNIRLYQLKALTNDYVFTVNYNGAPLAGANVKLRPTGIGFAMPTSNSLTNVATRYATKNLVTDALGNATFPAGDLSWGAKYQYVVLPPAGEFRISAAKGSFQVGIPLGNYGAFHYYVALDHINIPLAVKSMSTNDNSPSPDGSISYVFNQNIELYPETVDNITGTLSGNNGAELAPNVSANKASEQVTVDITGNVMKLTPIMKTKGDATKEPSLKISYSGIKVRAVDGPKLGDVISLSPTVSFFGGADSQLASISIVSGNNQYGGASAQLPQPLIVKALDQYSNPIASQLISFTEMSGGSVGNASVSTDAQGLAQTTWTLDATGDGSVRVRHSSVTYATAASYISVLAIESGNNQSRMEETQLTNPLVASLKDESGDGIAGQVITFTLDDGAADGELAIGAATSTNFVTGTTDADGEVTVNWTLGDVATTPLTPDTVSVSYSSNADLTFNGTPQVPDEISIVSGDAQTAVAGATLAMPLVAVVKDDTAGAAVIEGAVVILTIAGDGEVNNMTTGATITTDAAGQISGMWQLDSTSGANTIDFSITGYTPGTNEQATATGT